MAWDPVVLRKYNTTGHFRLLNQLRGELKSNPLVRPKEGERVADVNRSRSLLRALEGSSGSQRSRRGARVSVQGGEPQAPLAVEPSLEPALHGDLESSEDAGTAGFRDRLNAVELR